MELMGDPRERTPPLGPSSVIRSPPGHRPDELLMTFVGCDGNSMYCDPPALAIGCPLLSPTGNAAQSKWKILISLRWRTTHHCFRR